MRPAIRWRRLDLEGFGIWTAPTRFTFPERLGVLILPNEGGKSTMLAGLSAVLFGLKTRSDPREQGTTRYRSWSDHAGFRGSLEVGAHDRTLRFRRDFSSHETTIDLLDTFGATQEILFRGTANPEGQTSVRRAYQAILEEILGDLADEKLFSATFLVTQPILPVGKIEESLRRLISGVGRVGGVDAQRRLFEEIKSLTKLTRDLDVSASEEVRPTNQREDGEIERLEKTISDLESQRAATETAFDRLIAMEERLETTRAVRQSAEERLRNQAADLAGIEAYRKAVADRDVARRSRDDIGRVLEAHAARESDARKIRERIDSDYSDLDSVDDEAREALDEAVRLESQRVPLLERRESILREAAALSTRIEAMRTDPLIAGGELLPNPPAWVERVRETAGHWREAARRLIRTGDVLAQTRDELRRFQAVSDLAPDLREEIASLPQRIEDLRRAESTELRLADTQRMQEQDLARRRQEFAMRYKDLEGLHREPFLKVLQDRSDLHLRLRTLTVMGERQPEAAGSGTRRGLLASLFISILLAGAAGYLAQSRGLAAFPAGLVAVAALAVALLLAFRFVVSRDRGAGDPIQAEREVRDIQARLAGEFLPSGPWMPDDEGLLARGRAIFDRREEELASIAETERALVDATEGGTTDTDPSPREGIERIERIAYEIEEATGLSAAEAIGRFRDLERRIEDLKERRREEERSLTGSEDPPPATDARPDDLLELPVSALSDSWRDLPRIAGLFDPPAVTLRSLADRLDTAERNWRAWEETARAFASAQDRLEENQSDARDLDEKISGIERRLDAVRDRIGASAFEAADRSFEKLLARLRERNDLSVRLADAATTGAEILATAPGGPFESRDDLSRVHEEKDERRRDAQNAIDRLLEERALVAAYAGETPGEQDRIFRELSDRVEALSGEAEEAAREEVRARLAREDWAPPTHQSLAALELEIAEKRRAIAILRERRDASARAWHVLREAIAEFSASHRETIEESLDGRFRRLSGRSKRRVRLKEDLSISLAEGGIEFTEGQLSQGARDQLALCLRLAIADLVAGERVIPLILDDPFITSDSDRRVRIQEALAAASAERQILLVSHDNRIAGWGDAIRVDPL